MNPAAPIKASATGREAPRSDVLTTVAIAITAYNPIGPSLIVMSGVSSGFGAMAGLTLVPSLVEHRTAGIETRNGFLPRSRGWIVAGLIVGTFFVAVLGPGIRF